MIAVAPGMIIGSEIYIYIYIDNILQCLQYQ